MDLQAAEAVLGFSFVAPEPSERREARVDGTGGGRYTTVSATDQAVPAEADERPDSGEGYTPTPQRGTRPARQGPIAVSTSYIHVLVCERNSDGAHPAP